MNLTATLINLDVRDSMPPHLIDVRKRQLRVWSVCRRVLTRTGGAAPAPGAPYREAWAMLTRANRECRAALDGLDWQEMQRLDALAKT